MNKRGVCEGDREKLADDVQKQRKKQYLGLQMPIGEDGASPVSDLIIPGWGRTSYLPARVVPSQGGCCVEGATARSFSRLKPDKHRLQAQPHAPGLCDFGLNLISQRVDFRRRRAATIHNG